MRIDVQRRDLAVAACLMGVVLWIVAVAVEAPAVARIMGVLLLIAGAIGLVVAGPAGRDS